MISISLSSFMKVQHGFTAQLDVFEGSWHGHYSFYLTAGLPIDFLDARKRPLKGD